MHSDLSRYIIGLFLAHLISESPASSSNFDVNPPGTRDELFDEIGYLSKYGYMDDIGAKHHYDPDTISISVREFQKFNGLPVTGRLDKTTIDKMKQPRCGLPDIDKSKSRSSLLKFSLSGGKWPKRELTYKFVNYTRKLGGNQQISAIANAFKKWSDVTPLTFRQQSGSVEIEIAFNRLEHGDGAEYSFDGKGGVLAHASTPGNDASFGDVHFDDDENWTVGTAKGTDLEMVAAHEFGHSLGLGHSNVPEALMAPFFRGYDPNYSLHADDIRGIQTFYGSRPNPTRPSPRTTPRPTPRPTQRPIPRPTQRPKPRPTQRPVPRPTSRPTQRPKPRPTQRPSRRPTQRHTQRPRPRPTQRPSQRPYKPRNRRSLSMTTHESKVTNVFDGDHGSLTFDAIEKGQPFHPVDRNTIKSTTGISPKLSSLLDQFASRRGRSI